MPASAELTPERRLGRSRHRSEVILGSVCGVHTDGSTSCCQDTEQGNGTVRCWDMDRNAGMHRIRDFSGHPCFIDVLGGVECWLARTAAPLPVDTYSDALWIGVGVGSTCGVRRSDGELVCVDRRCSTDEDGVVSCRTGSLAEEYGPPPPGPFERFVEGTGAIGAVCALRENGEMACWGEGAIEAPAGVRFRTAAFAGGFPPQLCGVTLEGELACWAPEGEELPLPPPEGL